LRTTSCCKLDNRSPLAAGSRLGARLTLCDWAGFDGDVERLRTSARSGGLDSAPFPLLSIPSTPAEQLQCARSYLAHGTKPKPPLWRGERYEHPRIRLAYLSADLRDHPVAQLMAGVFEAHDRSAFETYAIAFGPDRDDPLRARLRQAFEHFIVLDDRDDQLAAELLRELEIDIAVDLMGYTRHCRTGILARRPAPVQVNYLGYPGTMGADFIDYIIADRHVIPPEDAVHYAERVVHLPVTLQPNDARRAIAHDPGTRAAAGLPDDGFVFCCMNNAYKISPIVFDVWMRLLRAVPRSVFWLSVRGTAAENLRREAQARGIDGNRLVFAARVDSHADYLARYRLADLFLDTLPYNAHTTASDALWAGLPLLTCTGSTFASRVATSVLHAVGLPELATADLAQYEALALELATHPARLAELRSRLAEHRTTYPLFDTARFCRDLEHAFRHMWLRQQSGLPPADSWQW
jgi:protein O-GlcNAc transferase